MPSIAIHHCIANEGPIAGIGVLVPVYPVLASPIVLFGSLVV